MMPRTESFMVELSTDDAALSNMRPPQAEVSEDGSAAVHNRLSEVMCCVAGEAMMKAHVAVARHIPQ